MDQYGAQQEVVEKWEVWEYAVKGRSDRNPFTDYEVSGGLWPMHFM